ncbi:MAG: hypothetical protein QW505_03770 [Thermoplasmata archaeon]
MQPQPMMYQPPPQQAPARPMSDYLRPLASDFVLALGALLGLFLMMLGSIIAGLTTGDARSVGWILNSFGMFVLTVVLLFGGIVRVDVDKFVRLAMILAAAFLIAEVGFW